MNIKDASIVDPFWGASFVVVAWVAFARSSDPGLRQVLVATLVTISGVRLAVHLVVRNLGRGEDYRYRSMRRRWGRQFPLISLGTVFVLQAVLMWVVSLPVQITMLESDAPGLLGYASVLLWVIGLFLEVVSD